MLAPCVTSASASTGVTKPTRSWHQGQSRTRVALRRRRIAEIEQHADAALSRVRRPFVSVENDSSRSWIASACRPRRNTDHARFCFSIPIMVLWPSRRIGTSAESHVSSLPAVAATWQRRRSSVLPLRRHSRGSRSYATTSNACWRTPQRISRHPEPEELADRGPVRRSCRSSSTARPSDASGVRRSQPRPAHCVF